MTEISDIDPLATDRYAALKQVKSFADSAEKKLRKLLNEADLGVRRLSQLLRQMRDLAQNGVSEEVLKSLWLQHLLQQMQAILTAIKHELEKLADRITDVLLADVNHNSYTDKSQFGRFANVRASRWSCGEIGNSFIAWFIASCRPRGILTETVQDHNRRASPVGIIDALMAKKILRILSNIRNSVAGSQQNKKLKTELFPTDSLAVATRRLIIKDRVTDIKFLVDIGVDVSTISVSKRNRTHIIGYSILQMERSSLCTKISFSLI